jgi:site-specific DNA-methyltransferase (adenine-specific)
MTVQIIHGDCRAAVELMPSNSIHSVVTDPPYALVSITKRFGKPGSAPAKDVYGRGAAGFTGKTWDTGEVAFDPAFWFEVLRVLKPGGHVLAFGGTRTYHRLACAIEDAGFEIRDQIGWLYGSGFPKSHNQSGEWEGWGTALKPAWEPIVVARKALDGTNAQNLARWGVGALNIDGCRVETTDNLGGGAYAVNPTTRDQLWGADAGNSWKRGGAGDYVQPDGRWPANVIHDGSDEVLDAFPSAPGQMAKVSSSDARKTQNVYGAMKRGSDGAEPRDTGGSAARFFYCAKASKADRNDGLDDFVARNDPAHRKTNIETTGENPYLRGATERKNTHPTVKPTELMRYLCRLVTPPGGTVLDPFMGSGSTGRGAVLEGFNFIGCETEAEYAAIAKARIAAVYPERDDSAPEAASAPENEPIGVFG